MGGRNFAIASRFTTAGFLAVTDLKKLQRGHDLAQKRVGSDPDL